MRFDADLLSRTLDPLVTHLAGRHSLTPGERAEVTRIAQGFACKDSANEANVSPETIRARRKRIYRKLELGGANDVIAALLAISLRLLARGGDATASRPEQTVGEAGAAATM